MGILRAGRGTSILIYARYSFRLRCSSRANTGQEENPPRKDSPWDDLLGYNAWGYRGRFRQVSTLAKRDFEMRGFEVKKCEVYSSQDGIYVQWHLDLRKRSK